MTNKPTSANTTEQDITESQKDIFKCTTTVTTSTSEKSGETTTTTTTETTCDTPQETAEFVKALTK